MKLDHFSSNVRRGDIYYADLSPVVGSEQGGMRPVLIVQNNVGNRYSPTVIAAAITSQLNKAKLPTHIEIEARTYGLSKDSVILLEQVRTLDKRRLREKMGRLDEQVMDVALMAPKQEVFLEASERNVMSVEIPVFEYKTRTADLNDIYSYGFAFTSADLDDAVLSLSEVLPDMLKLAEIEKSCQLMAAEIEKTRRRVNALEHVMIPDLQTNIKYITMKLDENERSTQIRLMKVKDMMLEQAHHYSERAAQ